MNKSIDLINTFKINAQKFNNKIALNIINSLCISNMENESDEFKTNICSFAYFLKSFDPELYFNNKDLIIFKIHEQIIEEKLAETQSNIHSQLLPQQIVVASNFVKQIHSLNKSLNCSVNINGKIHCTTTENTNDFLSLVEYSLFNRNGLFLFINTDENTETFCFVLNDNSFKELKITPEMKNELNDEFPLFSENLTTFSQFNTKNT